MNRNEICEWIRRKCLHVQFSLYLSNWAAVKDECWYQFWTRENSVDGQPATDSRLKTAYDWCGATLRWLPLKVVDEVVSAIYRLPCIRDAYLHTDWYAAEELIQEVTETEDEED